MAEVKGETLPFPDIRELMKGVPTDGKDWHVVAFLRRSPAEYLRSRKGAFSFGRRQTLHIDDLVFGCQEGVHTASKTRDWCSEFSVIVHSYIEKISVPIAEPFRRRTTALCGQSCQYIALKDNERFSSPFRAERCDLPQCQMSVNEWFIHHE